MAHLSQEKSRADKHMLMTDTQTKSTGSTDHTEKYITPPSSML